MADDGKLDWKALKSGCDSLEVLVWVGPHDKRTEFSRNNGIRERDEMLANRTANHLRLVHMVWKDIGELVQNRLRDGGNKVCMPHRQAIPKHFDNSSSPPLEPMETAKVQDG